MGLTILEWLQDIAHLQKIEVGRFDLPRRIRGLYYEEGNYRSITINMSLNTTNEEVDVMAEEIGHSVVGGGDLFFPEGVDPVVKRKTELRAKNYAYNLVLPAKMLIRAFKQNKGMDEIAEEFCVTETFIKEAVKTYKVKGLFPDYRVN